MFKKRSVNNAAVKEALLPENQEEYEGGLVTSINADGDDLDGESAAYARRLSSVQSSKAEDETRLEGLKQFNTRQTNDGELFKELTLRTWIDTQYDVVNVTVAKDSKSVLCVLYVDDTQFQIRGYDLHTYGDLYCKVIKGEYLKMNEITESDYGGMFCVPYQDNGKFYVLVCDMAGKDIATVDVSSILVLNDHSKPITGFWEPIIVATFLPDNQLFVAAYHRIEKKQYHFIYDVHAKKQLSKIISSEIGECTDRNFPIKAFYTPILNEIYVFYRQGHGYTINPEDPSKWKCKKITNDDLGNMYLLFDQALITRSSSSITFFKIDEETGDWTQYYKIPKIRGSIYFIKGNIRFQITTDEKVYFYLICKETFKPILENVMYNFMQCSKMLFGRLVRNCITFKTNQPGFTIYKRKFYHNAKIQITADSYEGAVGQNLATKEAYVMAEQKSVSICDNKTFTQIQRWNIPTKGHADDFQILSMAVSEDESKIGLLLGKLLIRDQVEICEIAIYNNCADEGDAPTFELQKLRDWDANEKACVQFSFDKFDDTKLIFFKANGVFRFDYTDESAPMEAMCDNFSLSETPICGVFNDDQTKFIVTTSKDIYFINLDADMEPIDIDESEGISAIQSIIPYKDKFYILANKKEGRLGYFLMSIDGNDPKAPVDYLISWSNKLDIGCCDMQIMNEEDGSESIVVSYKCIGINTYNIFVIDLHSNIKGSNGGPPIAKQKQGKPGSKSVKWQSMIKYWHESYQLWESPIKGFLLSTNEFMVLFKDGINLLAVGKQPERVIKDKEGLRRKLHSLGSKSYLKIEDSNHLLYACQYYEDRQLCIQQQYDDANKNTQFTDIYKVHVQEPTLRELLIIQSIYTCKKQSDIELLVKEQPDPRIFLKVFFELGFKNLLYYLAFDSRSIKNLLNDDNEKYFGNEFPIFFKNDQGTSALDTALSYNQIRSVNLMVSYMVKHQNKFVYAHLFEKNMVDFINKGVDMYDLFQSDILNYHFDFDEWPATSENEATVMKPFSGSLFSLRQSFEGIFPELHAQHSEMEKTEREKKEGKHAHRLFGMEKEDAKVYKIKYSLNILPSMNDACEEDLMEAIIRSEELKIFESEGVIDMVDYKWDAFAFRRHLIGTFFHLIYLVCLIAYIDHTFLQAEVTHRGDKTRQGPECSVKYMFVLFGCLIYPTSYDMTQMIKQGGDYFLDAWNYLDMMHIALGYANIVCQSCIDTWALSSKLVLLMVILVCLLKTFFFMRIVKKFSYIVTMINMVFRDLLVFLLFYAIQIIMFSLLFDVISPPPNPKDEDDQPTSEYRHMPKFMGNLLTTVRLSLGDFAFEALQEPDFMESDEGNFDKINPDALTDRQHMMFWVVWILMVVFSALVFLNFIIAEVSNSYQTVKKDINALIYKERATLTQEAEDIMTDGQRQDRTLFPRFFVIREVEK